VCAREAKELRWAPPPTGSRVGRLQGGDAAWPGGTRAVASGLPAGSIADAVVVVQGEWMISGCAARSPAGISCQDRGDLRLDATWVSRRACPSAQRCSTC